MKETSRLRTWLALSASTAAMGLAAPALAQNTSAGPGQGGLGPKGAAPSPNNSAVPSQSGPLGTGPSANGATGLGANTIQELVVTAQRREESIQDAPVAVSAFSADSLKAQRIDGGENLVLSVPNVNYSRTNFGGYNFQIRGVGTHLVTNSGEAGVSFNVNTLPVAANHLGDADFYDVERVEVLRGPQGTLYGRTATGGAVNVITAKPTDRFGGSITSEFGNFDSRKVTGYLNVPVNEFFAFRVAGFYLNRDGYGTNTANGDRVDGRDLNSFRFTGALKFNDRLKASLYFEDFNEKDDRNRVGKQLCITDPGPASIGGVATNAINRGFFSQGCQSGSLYQDAAYGLANAQATTGGIFATYTGLLLGNPNAGHPLQDRNLHNIESAFDPVYEAKERLAIAQIDYQLTDNLTLSSITGYNRETDNNAEDYNRTIASVPYSPTPLSGAIFPASIAAAYQAAGVPAAQAFALGQGAYAALYAKLFPGGYVLDPQLGARNRFTVADVGNNSAEEKTEEIRITSSYKGKLNFSAGAIYESNVVFSNYFVLFNPLTAFIQAVDALSGDPGYTGTLPGTFFVDPSPTPTSTGHNYYDSRYGNELNSYAAFGELYYNLLEDLKVTAGFRYTVDNRKGQFYPSLLFAGGNGIGTVTRQKVSFQEPTARFNVEWSPHLSFTNQTIVYGTYSHGYKSGGFNTPTQDSNFNAIIPDPFQPEIVDAFEVGTKNTLLNGSLILNLTGFYYDYSGYQISTIRNKASFNSNVDAEIYGLEFEGIWQPIHNLTLNTNIGYLHTKVKDLSQYDPADPTLGDPALQVIKDTSGENCVVTVAGLAQVLTAVGNADPLTQLGALVGIPGAPTAPGLCNGGGALGAVFPGLYNYGNRSMQYGVGVQSKVGLGVLQNLAGNDLPNSPAITLAIGAQYVVDLSAEWKATIRGDFYWQDDSYSRYFNSTFDRLEGYENVNATLSFDNARLRLNLQLFVKNLTDSQPFTSTYLTAQDSALFTNIFTLDPRTYGVSLTKRF